MRIISSRTHTIIGVLSELTSTSPASPMKLVPMRIHLGMDVLLGLVLALSPWLFGFREETLNVWLPHLVVGILIIGYALMTRPNGTTGTSATGDLPTAAH